MKVTPYDTPLRWHVTSESRDDVCFLVDLGANNGFGRCTCEHHGFKLQPQIDAGDPNAKRCKHVLEAREALLDETITALRKLDKNDTE